MPDQDDLTSQALRYRFIYSMAGLCLGLVCMLGGVALFFHGVTGSTSWTAKILGNTSAITDAAPGVVLFIVGLFVVIVTRFHVKINQSKDKDREWDQVAFSLKPKEDELQETHGRTNQEEVGKRGPSQA